MEEVNLVDFEKEGYVVLKNFFTKDEVLNLEKNIVNFYALQALKFPEFENKQINKSPLDFCTKEEFYDIICFFEEFNKKAGFHAHSFITKGIVGKKFIFNEKLFGICSQILNCPPELLILDDDAPCLLLNIPQSFKLHSKRMIYDLHSEKNYYPMRRNMLNIWAPIFNDKLENNGTMFVLPGSHLKNHNCAFWRMNDNSLSQAQIPREELSEFKEIPIIAEPKDLVIFHANLVHRGSVNETDEFSATLIARIFDYSKDLIIDSIPGAGFLGSKSDSVQSIKSVSY
jgi:hypothetical protein